MIWILYNLLIAFNILFALLFLVVPIASRKDGHMLAETKTLVVALVLASIFTANAGVLVLFSSEVAG